MSSSNFESKDSKSNGINEYFSSYKSELINQGISKSPSKVILRVF